MTIPSPAPYNPRLPEPMNGGNTTAISLRDFWYVVFRHRAKVTVFLLAVTATAGFLVLRSPDTFVSEAQLLVQQGRQSRVDPTAAAGQSVHMYAEWEQQFNSELSILGSRELAEEVARQVGPEVILGVPESVVEQKIPFANAVRSWFDRVQHKMQRSLQPGASETPARPPYLDLAALTVMNALSVSVPEKSNIISLSYSSADPGLAERVLAQLTEAYLVQHISVHQSVGSYDFFKEQVTHLKRELEGLDQQQRDLNNELGVASLDTRRSHLANRVSELESGIKEAETAIATSAAKVEVLAKRLPGTADAVPRPSPGTGLLKTRGLSDQDAYLQLQMRLLDEEAEVASQKARLAALQTQLADAGRNLQTLNSKDLARIQLVRQKELLESKYRTYANNLEQARIDQELVKGQISNIAIVQHATHPVHPENANRKMKLALAIVFGLVGGIGVAFVFEYFDSSLRRPEDVEARLELPTLVSIPYAEPDRLSVVPGTAGQDVTTEPPSASTFHYDVLRERVLLSLNGSASAPVMLAVTSVSEGEGVSTVAANLAMTLARGSDQRVLFVDANLHHPSADDLFGVKRGPGLAEILTDGKGATTTVTQNLYVLSAGESTQLLPANIVPERFDSLLRLVKERDYDFVVFDVPAISEGTTATRVANLVNGVILVSEAEKVRWEVALRAKTLLTEAKANILGVVLNKRRYYVPQWLYQKL